MSLNSRHHDRTDPADRGDISSAADRSSPPRPGDAARKPGSSAGRQLPWFLVVGCTAAATHFGIVVALMETRPGMEPLLANVLGWFGAFWVSWAGHHFLTFAAERSRVWPSLLKFGLVSASGFAINEGAYAVLLRLGGLRYDVALGLVLVGVAVATFFASRHWAFVGKDKAGH